MADDDKTTSGPERDEPAPQPPAPRRPAPRPDEDAEETSAFDVIGQYVRPGRDNVILIYILYLVGLVPAFGGIPILAGFVMAVLNREEVGSDLASHYEFQVRQAIAGFVAVVVSAVLVFVLIGIVGLILVAVWWVIRSVKGLSAATRGDPVADPKTYSW